MSASLKPPVPRGGSVIVRGDARALPLPDASVDLIVTSPPFWALRSYTDGGEHYAGQIGSEPTPREYVAELLACTCTTPTGSAWPARSRRPRHHPSGPQPGKSPTASTERTSMKRRIAGIVALGVLAVASLSACKANEPYQDAPVSNRQRTPAQVIDLPDGFSNVATVCNNGNRVYVIFHGDSAYGSVAVVPQDPTCTGN